MMGLRQHLFGFEGHVGRRAYVTAGVALMALKYAVDALLVWLATDRLFSPWRYLNPVASFRLDELDLPAWVVVAMILWALPFLWIGLSMSLRRALDAGFRGGTALFFLVPIGNLFLIAALSVAPSRPRRQLQQPGEPGREGRDARVLAKATLIGILAAVGMTAFSTLVLGAYGGALFVGTPVLMGFITGWLANRERPRALSETLRLAAFVAVLSGLAVLLFALEGVLCLTMAMPLTLPLVALGAFMGRRWADRVDPSGATAALLCLPLLMGAEHGLADPAPLRSVTTETVVEAPPEVVWKHVVGFSELPPPNRLIFALGIAYPMRAEIRGTGVGAVRHCVFSTGPFVEPITAWEPPRRLAFDVSSQPPAMREASPYNHVYAPHLDSYPSTERGEFLLQRLPGGRTRLVGTTWYRLDLSPQRYWTVISDAVIHGIHGRVLAHVRQLSET